MTALPRLEPMSKVANGSHERYSFTFEIRIRTPHAGRAIIHIYSAGLWELIYGVRVISPAPTHNSYWLLMESSSAFKVALGRIAFAVNSGSGW